LLSCGNRTAIASWGNFSAQGRWVWWLKNWIDRRFIARFRQSDGSKP
jgi:NADH dehydrogenase FAD-containing subunit